MIAYQQAILARRIFCIIAALTLYAFEEAYVQFACRSAA